MRFPTGAFFGPRGSHVKADAGYTCAPMNSSRSAPIKPLSDARCWLAIVLGLLICAAPVAARDDATNPNRPDDQTPAERGILYPDEPKQKVSPITLPPFPRASDLIPLRAGRGEADYTYYIDVNSVRLGSDEVLYYTVVIQSDGGASNIIYEGIRCATDEVKSLAYGTRDGRFELLPDAQWTYFYNEGPLGYRNDLVEIYACSSAGWAVEPDTVLERLVRYDPRQARVAPKNVEAGDGD